MSASQNPTNPTLPQGQKSGRIRGMTRFFCWCGGANLDVLEDYSNSKNFIFTGGVLVFLTGVFAWVSGGYAMYTIFGSLEVAIAVGFIWGAFIFFMDRFFVSSIKKQSDGNRWKELLQASPRLTLAVLIGFVVARPLELRIFSPEIEKELNEQKAKELEADNKKFQRLIMDLQEQQDSGRVDVSSNYRIVDYDTQIVNLENKLNGLEARKNELDQVYMCERYGTVDCPPGYVRSGKVGWGPESKKRKKDYDDFVANMPKMARDFSFKIEELQKKRINLQNVIEQRDASFKESKQVEKDSTLARKLRSQERIKTDFKSSLLNRNQALTIIEGKEPGAKALIWGLTIFFIFLEIAPVLGKILAPYSSYDNGLEEAHYADQDEITRRRHVSKEELKVNRMLVRMLSNAQRQVVQERIKNWKKEQIREERSRGRTHQNPGEYEEEERKN